MKYKYTIKKIIKKLNGRNIVDNDFNLLEDLLALADKPKEECTCVNCLGGLNKKRCLNKLVYKFVVTDSQKIYKSLKTKPEIEKKFTDSDVVYMCETILGYLDMGRIDEAKQHLENLQHWFIDLPNINSKLLPPLKTKPEIEKIDMASYSTKVKGGRDTEIEIMVENKLNELIDRVNLLSTEGKEGKE